MCGKQPMVARIEEKLSSAFAPSVLEVVDDSESHRGHAGFQEGGESHFNVKIRSDAFKGKTRIARHRAVHAALGPQIIGEIHALALDLDV
ncbi:BolA family protein [Algirhabdus cladophorae]|uniref:BolA family protein n=1 Tax=Algirhabdus cladophorae TaxID=3377108 RepID=UPI003B8493EF